MRYGCILVFFALLLSFAKTDVYAQLSTTVLASAELLAEKQLESIRKGRNSYVHLQVFNDRNSLDIVLPGSVLRSVLKDRQRVHADSLERILSRLISEQAITVADFDYEYLRDFQVDSVFFRKINTMSPDVVAAHFFTDGMINRDITGEMQRSIIMYMLKRNVEMGQDSSTGFPCLLRTNIAKVPGH